MLTPDQIRSAGLAALQKRLGRAGMIRFLQLYSPGRGDYAVERHAWVDSQDFAALQTRIRQQRTTRRAKKRAKPSR